MENLNIKLSPDSDIPTGGQPVEPEKKVRQEKTESVALQKINAALAEIGSQNRWRIAPEFLPEYERLKGKKIVMVDDTFMAIENILPELVVATDGNATAIPYKEQSLQKLVSEIMSTDPDVIILDYHLSEKLKGITVAKELISAGYMGKFVGCSSDRDAGKEFAKIGSLGNIDKIHYPTSEAIKKLAGFFNQ